MAIVVLAGAGSAAANPQSARTSAAPDVNAIAVHRAGAPPRWVRGTDGRIHLEYNLVETNVFTAGVTLRSIDVRGGGRRLLRLAGPDLARATSAMFSADATREIPASGAVTTVMDVVLPDGRPLPRELTHVVRYAYPRDAQYGAIIGGSIVRAPTLDVPRERPIVVEPPLRGDGWVALNACCEPSSHRSLVLSTNGSFTTPEPFAIDWLRVEGGRFFRGDGTRNRDWAGYGEPVYAATGGTAVRVRRDAEDVPPFATLDQNPTVRKTGDFGGNNVVIRVRRGVFALYGHLAPGSPRVHRGDHVRTGERIGTLGNTGNTSAPHLHFGLFDGSEDPLTSNSVPFVLRRFRSDGVAQVSDALEVTTPERSHRAKREYPLFNVVTAFGPH